MLINIFRFLSHFADLSGDELLSGKYARIVIPLPPQNIGLVTLFETHFVDIVDGRRHLLGAREHGRNIYDAILE